MVNLIHFIKTESQRHLNKLHENANANKLIKKTKEDEIIPKNIEIKTIINKDNNNYNIDNIEKGEVKKNYR